MNKLIQCMIMVSSLSLVSCVTSGTTTERANQGSQMKNRNTSSLKHAVGVVDFENNAGWSGRWELGRNLSVMLESALFDSGNFIVVERESLDKIIKEQDLAASGRSRGGNKVATTGNIRAAKYLATGAITEVEYDEAGAGAGVNIKGFNIGLGGGQAHIATIIKLVDTTTGEIIAKERVIGKAGKRKIKLGYRGSNWGGDIGAFQKTPLGSAAQDVIAQAVDFLSTAFQDIPFDASVVQVAQNGTIIINRGSEHGVYAGQEFEVRTAGEELIDPDTGEVLDVMEGDVLCTISVSRVKEKVAYCKLVSGELPERGSSVLPK